MAFCSILISVPAAFVGSLAWVVLSGGSFLGFLLVYAVSGQVGFILSLAALLASDHLRQRARAVNERAGKDRSDSLPWRTGA